MRCDVGGEREIYYEVHGDPSKPTILLIHGHTASSAVFSAMVSSLTDKRHVLLVDLLGHGRSSRHQRPPRHLWEENAIAILRLLDQLRIHRLDLLGTGGGAVVALNLTILAPSYIRRAIADSFYGLGLLPGEAVELAAGREQAMMEPGISDFWHSLHGDDWREVVSMNTIAITEAARRRLPLYVGDPARIVQPTLMTGSETDDLIPEAGERLRSFARYLPSAEVIVFERGGHPAMFSNASPFLAALEGFLGG